MHYLAISLPGGQTITAPNSIPSGGIGTVSKVFRNSFVILLIICVVLSLIFIVYSGIQWILSGGDKNKLQAARARLNWAIIGLIVAFVAFFIVSLIGYFFKVDLLKFA
jgi:ABC-type Fe3+ transport system permease subunit